MDLLETMIRLFAACEGLSTQDKLDALQLAWLAVASQARTDMLVRPGGFPEEKTRQVDLLRKMADVIAADKPDLEIARLYQEGDTAGLIRLIKKRIDDAKAGDGEDP